jgi:hypothetical protein
MNHVVHQGPKRGESGAILLISMIFLVILTLIVVSAIRVTNVNTKLATNLQIEKESEAAALQAIETVISTDFTTLATPATVTVDVDDSGTTGSNYVVSLSPAPVCIGVKPIKLSEQRDRRIGVERQLALRQFELGNHRHRDRPQRHHDFHHGTPGRCHPCRARQFLLGRLPMACPIHRPTCPEASEPTP